MKIQILFFVFLTSPLLSSVLYGLERDSLIEMRVLKYSEFDIICQMRDEDVKIHMLFPSVLVFCSCASLQIVGVKAASLD